MRNFTKAGSLCMRKLARLSPYGHFYFSRARKVGLHFYTSKRSRNTTQGDQQPVLLRYAVQQVCKEVFLVHFELHFKFVRVSQVHSISPR